MRRFLIFATLCLPLFLARDSLAGRSDTDVALIARLGAATSTSATVSPAKVCLALAVYHEARGTTPLEQLRVAHVVLNRLKLRAWGSTVCGVVYAPSQFSWTFQLRDRTPRDRGAWLNSLDVAETAFMNFERGVDPSNGADHFVALSPRVRPPWARPAKMVAKGVHSFYRLMS